MSNAEKAILCRALHEQLCRQMGVHVGATSMKQVILDAKLITDKAKIVERLTNELIEDDYWEE